MLTSIQTQLSWRHIRLVPQQASAAEAARVSYVELLRGRGAVRLHGVRLHGPSLFAPFTLELRILAEPIAGNRPEAPLHQEGLSVHLG